MDCAPKRRGPLTTLTFSRSGPSRSIELHCRSGEFTTLELTCSPANAGCNVDLWQDQRAKPLGGAYDELLYVQQSGFVYRSVLDRASEDEDRYRKRQRRRRSRS